VTRLLSLVLTDHGYEVETAQDGEAALARVTPSSPQLVITDLKLSHMDGLELCRRIRARSTVPIIVVSAAAEVATKVDALDAGADDYLTKPFSMDELMARVRARLRRPGGGLEDASFDVGDFHLDIASRQVVVRGQEVRLTPTEFELFVYFAHHPNVLLTYGILLQAVWGNAGYAKPEYVRIFIGQLRKKLEADPSHPRYLVTEAWMGYRFHPHG
jgi:two-component system KDP operon response regulator KdpE